MKNYEKNETADKKKIVLRLELYLSNQQTVLFSRYDKDE